MQNIAESPISASELLTKLKTSASGLSEKEARKRILPPQKYGLTALKKVARIFLRQLESPLIILLIFAAAVAYILGEKTDALVVFGIILLNTAIGFLQEYHSYAIIKGLKKYIPNFVLVLRESKTEKTIQEKVVVGDIVILNAGDLAPADIRLLESENVTVDESALTGESITVTKKETDAPSQNAALPENIIFAGTKIATGQGRGVVFAAGQKTKFGNLEKFAEGENKKSLFAKHVSDFSLLLLAIVSSSLLFIFVLSLIIHKGNIDVPTLLLFAVALAVGILPEALPAITTIALSHGARRLAKKHVVVKRLSAVEDLGDIDVLCADKTGTITENKMTVSATEFSSDKNRLLSLALLANEEKEKNPTNNERLNNPFDIALQNAVGKELPAEFQSARLVKVWPFNAETKINLTLIILSGKTTLISRGAPESILLRCGNSYNEKSILDKINEFGQKGWRVLAVASKVVADDQEINPQNVSGLTFEGIIAFEDPLKKSAEDALRIAEKLGIETKIITGDHPSVAASIAQKINLISQNDSVLSGDDLEKLQDSQFQQAIQNNKVFARTDPEQKLRIIKGLEKAGKKVGYMGDGVNDVPSLAAAHVAIAVPSATAAAKDMADIVLLRNDLKVLVSGITEGRKIFRNMSKYLLYALGGNLGNFFSLAIISLISPVLPMLPTQILLGNFISDFPLIGIGWDSTEIKELRKPQHYDLSHIKKYAMIFAVISSIFDFVFFGLFRHLQEDSLRTLWFIESMLTEILLLASIRSVRGAFSKPRPANILLITSITGITATLWLPYSPLENLFHFTKPNISLLTAVIMLSLIYAFTNEAVKAFIRRPRHEPKKVHFLSRQKV